MAQMTKDKFMSKRDMPMIECFNYLKSISRVSTTRDFSLYYLNKCDKYYDATIWNKRQHCSLTALYNLSANIKDDLAKETNSRIKERLYALLDEVWIEINYRRNQHMGDSVARYKKKEYNKAHRKQ